MSSLAALLVSSADSPDTFVTSAMLDEGDVHQTSQKVLVTMDSPA